MRMERMKLDPLEGELIIGEVGKFYISRIDAFSFKKQALVEITSRDSNSCKEITMPDGALVANMLIIKSERLLDLPPYSIYVGWVYDSELLREATEEERKMFLLKTIK